jgi:spoIIIJ-associated protein
MRSGIAIKEEPGMSQQEDVVAHDAGQDDQVGSLQAVSSGAEEHGEAQGSLEEDDAELDADDLTDDVDDIGDDDDEDGAAGPEEVDGQQGQPRSSVADLELEGEIAADYIEGLLDVADLDGDIDMDVEGDRAVVSVVGATLDELVGRRGEVLEALQELTRLAVHQHTGSRTRMMLDVGGYRQRRRAELAEAGQDAAEEVRRTGQPKRLWPMNPFERKVVHDAVAAAGLRSESEGEEPDRRVVVLPVG